MESVLNVDKIKKTFDVSKKQQRIMKTTEKKKVALDGLSFKAYGGEIYGLLGPNGAGKTTAMRIISTLIKPDEGDVIVFNDSIRENPDLIRKKIAFLTSELKLEDFFTPDFLYNFYSDLHDVSEADREKRKKTLFMKFGIDKFKEVKIGELSTGMRQKVSIAISLAHDPEIIIYDEPTNGLDIITAKIVTDFILDLKKQGKCIIISTHIFSLVEKVSDRVGIIIDGKMVKEGTLKEVTAGGSLEDKFFEIYESIERKEA